MKRFVVFAVCVLMAFATMMALGATNNTEYSNGLFTVDTLTVRDQVYTTLGSLTVTQDTTGNTLFFVTGACELRHDGWIHLVLCTDTTTSGVPEIVVGAVNDTTTVTKHEWYWRENIGDSPMRIPFTFLQNLDTDSVGGPIKLYLMGKAESNYHPVYLYDVRIEAITNLADQP